MSHGLARPLVVGAPGAKPFTLDPSGSSGRDPLTMVTATGSSVAVAITCRQLFGRRRIPGTVDSSRHRGWRSELND